MTLAAQTAGPWNEHRAIYVKGIIHITGDATAIAEILKRMLDNALKFTP